MADLEPEIPERVEQPLGHPLHVGPRDPAADVAYQLIRDELLLDGYYNFFRLGRNGFTAVQQASRDVAMSCPSGSAIWPSSG